MGFVLFVSEKYIKFHHGFSLRLFSWYFIVLLWSVLGVLIFQLDFDFNRFLGFIFVAITSLISFKYFNTFSLENTIRWFLYIHLFFFYTQLLGYYLFGIELDFLVKVTGEKQRVFGGTFNLPYLNKFIRPSGLYQEPGTYVTFLAPLIALFVIF